MAKLAIGGGKEGVAIDGGGWEEGEVSEELEVII